MAEIDENKRQNEIENEKMMTMTEHTDVNDNVEAEVEVEILTDSGGNVGEESVIRGIEVDEEIIAVEEVMITNEEVVGEGETQNKEEVEEEKEEKDAKGEKEAKSILEETETGKKLNGISIPSTEPSLSLYEYSPKSVKSLTPIFSRLTQPILKTEIVANKIETKNEPIPLFSAVPKGCKIEKTGNDDEWNLDLLASSPMPMVIKLDCYYSISRMFIIFSFIPFIYLFNHLLVFVCLFVCSFVCLFSRLSVPIYFEYFCLTNVMFQFTF